MDAQVAVVGGGVMGLMTACALEARGVDVVVLEQFEVGHDRGSSHGATRIFRLLYDDPLYIEMAAKSLPLWRGFGEVLDLTGGLQIDEPGVLDRYERAMSPWDVKTKRIDENTMWLDAMGVLDARHVVELAHDRVRDRVREGVVVERFEDGVLKTSDGDVRSQSVVIAAGAWVTGFADLPVRVTREQVVYFAGATSEMLPWVHGRDHWIYGIPRDGRVKVAEHGTGAATTADERSFEPDEAGVERVRFYVEKYLPTVDPEPVAVETCLYTNTPDEDFIIDKRDEVLVVSPCSGHGFKFAPLIGEIAANLALDEPPPMSPEHLTRLRCKTDWRMR